MKQHLPWVVMAAAACGKPVVCSQNQVWFEGRPSVAIEYADSTCSKDCPVKNVPASCTTLCEPISLLPALSFLSPSELTVFDDHSLPVKDERQNLLRLRFGYFVPPTAGAPAPSLLEQGPRQYVANAWEGVAQFRIDVARVLVEKDQNPLAGTEDGPVAAARPGQLEVTAISEQGIAGEFHLAFETSTGQPQGQMNGCFNLALAQADVGGAWLGKGPAAE